MPTPEPDSLEARVRALAEEAVADADLFVVGVDVRGFQGSRVVSVYVDGPGGAGSDDLVALTRSLSFTLDAEDFIKGRYRLDVSTPGADAPLSDLRQFPQHVGREIAVTYEAGQDQLVTAQAPLLAVEGEAIVLDGEAAPIPFAAVRDARVVLPW